MLSRRRMAFSHVIYTSGFFFLTIAFALIAIIAVTLRFSERTQVLKVAVGPAIVTTQNSSKRLRVIWSVMVAAFDLLFFRLMIWHKAPKLLNKDAPISPSFAVISLFRRTVLQSLFYTTTSPSSPRRQAPQSLRQCQAITALSDLGVKV